MRRVPVAPFHPHGLTWCTQFLQTHFIYRCPLRFWASLDVWVLTALPASLHGVGWRALAVRPSALVCVNVASQSGRCVFAYAYMGLHLFVLASVLVAAFLSSA